jgi:hypothetical protein
VTAGSDPESRSEREGEAGGGTEAAPDAEFPFELRVCRWAERAWPPAGDDVPVVVARQLGVRSRRWDTVIVECDPAGLRARGAFGREAFDSDLLHVLRHAPAEWTYYRDALPDPGYPWRYVREAVHAAAERGAVEERRRGGRIELRRVRPYPDWIRRIVAVENKPDLSASAARDLAGQLRRDVALGLADEAWVATRATGRRVEPALLERLPVEAGILAVSDPPTTAEVAWHASALDVATPGTRITERAGGGDHDRSAARFEYVDADWKANKRLAIAERAYERGWRAYADAMRTDCRQFRLAEVADGEWLPRCGAKERHQTAAECSGSCPAFEPEPPAWRTRGWPIEGGPGAGVERALARRRARRRPGRRTGTDSG